MGMGTKSVKCAVIIPYYQTSPGPLGRAIASILAQEEVERPSILVVDDGSPISAQESINACFDKWPSGLRVIKQVNARAAAARNTALDNLPETTELVAFLDSDDSWHPRHLWNAFAALERGCDFYFADHRRVEWATGKFERIGFDPGIHQEIPGMDGVYKYLDDPILPILRDHLIQTSTVVCRRELLEDIRFPTDLILGEDEVVWVKAIRRAHAIGVGRGIDVDMGRGVNISQGGEWGCVRAFELLAQNMRYWKQIVAKLPDEASIGELRKSRVRQLRADLAYNLFFQLRRGQSLPIKHILDFTYDDPAWLLGLPIYFIKALLDKRA